MKIDELKKQSVEEIKTSLANLREQKFKLGMQKSIGQLRQTHLLKENKKAIARAKTLLIQKAAGK